MNILSHLEYIECCHGNQAECHDGHEGKNGALNPPRSENASISSCASALSTASADRGVGGKGVGGLDRSEAGKPRHPDGVRLKLLDAVAKVVRHLSE